jgi:hypothetical protein
MLEILVTLKYLNEIKNEWFAMEFFGNFPARRLAKPLAQAKKNETDNSIHNHFDFIVL